MMLTIQEVAAQLKVSASLAYRLVKSGVIPSYSIASCKRVDEVDLRAYLRSQREAPLKQPRSDKRHF